MSLVKVKRIENSLKCKALENKETIVYNGDGDCYPIKPGLRFEVIHCIYCKCIFKCSIYPCQNIHLLSNSVAMVIQYLDG